MRTLDDVRGHFAINFKCFREELKHRVVLKIAHHTLPCTMVFHHYYDEPVEELSEEITNKILHAVNETIKHGVANYITSRHQIGLVQGVIEHHSLAWSAVLNCFYSRDSMGNLILPPGAIEGYLNKVAPLPNNVETGCKL